MSVNKIILVGHVGKDVESRNVNGQTVASFSLATSEKWNDKNGNRQERTEWHNLVVWGKIADFCDQYVQKGSLLFVEGRLQTREYDDRDGNRRRVTEVVVSELRLLSGGRNGERTGERDTPAPKNDQKPKRAGARTASAPSSASPSAPPPDDGDDIPF